MLWACAVGHSLEGPGKVVLQAASCLAADLVLEEVAGSGGPWLAAGGRQWGVVCRLGTFKKRLLCHPSE